MDDALSATRAALLEEVAAAYVNQTRFAAEVARALATRLGLAAAVHKHDELVGLARHWHNETEQELALKADSFALEKVRDAMAAGDQAANENCGRKVEAEES